MVSIMLEILHGRTTWSSKGKVIAGGHGPGNALNQLNSSYGIFVQLNDDLFISDYSNNRVVKWEKDATTGILYAGGQCGIDNHDHLCHPTALTFDREGTMYVTVENGTNGGVVRKKSGATTTEMFIMTNSSLYGIVWDEKEEFLYLGHHREHQVSKYTKDGQFVAIVAGGHGRGAALNQLDYPRGVAVDQDGSVYVADSNNQRIIKWEANAKEGVVVFGGHGIGNRTDQLNVPAALLRDKTGTIYVVDERNDRILAVSPGIQDATIIAGGNSQLNRPIYLAFNSKLDLYISDTDNFQIQLFPVEDAPSGAGINILISNWRLLFCFLTTIVLLKTSVSV
ncbi:unnamed protein product [Adineta ricciae]|uniref:Uncharacterized protein n=1 Tax=Adineta ricciae TaxID=249248 RepID=A0A815S6D1_ADIRI|nr:unnamed protein product [Adineta ricciae]